MKKIIVIDKEAFKEAMETENPEYRVRFDTAENIIRFYETDTDNGHTHIYERTPSCGDGREIYYLAGLALSIHRKGQNRIANICLSDDGRHIRIALTA